ncbi:hypothetical protein EVAR_24935_1 [Eumeta japonica]|uniref:Uncharacterized protein n=1 Tax=Eumeta variegata TaxID=151549 RepID=A0A4C1V5X4_EUMVA|nr:hypothetical protein EVAR_24935_1 [Eumeta japonica]
MAGKGILSPQSNKLLEETVDGASLIYDSIEAHNCEQLKRWLKCHGRSQKVKKNELMERTDHMFLIKQVIELDKNDQVSGAEAQYACRQRHVDGNQAPDAKLERTQF